MSVGCDKAIMLTRNDSDASIDLNEHTVTGNWLESVLLECFSKERPDASVTVTSYEMVKSTDASDALFSDILAVSIDFRLDGEQKSMDVVIKLLPLDPFSRYFVTEWEFDLREIKFYTEIVTDLENFQSEWVAGKEKAVRLPVAKCYLGKHVPFALSSDLPPATSDKINESIIVLENLQKLGYRKACFKSGLGLQQAQLALEAVSSLHALSLAMKVHEKKPLFEKYQFLFQTEKASLSYQHLMERDLPQLNLFLEKRSDMKAIVDRLRDIRPKAKYLIETLLRPREPISLIIHTDFWANNLLFAGEECVLLDWQMVTCSQPTNDLAILIMSSLPSEVRRDHTTSLLDHYWLSFTGKARTLGVDIEKDFNYEKDDFLADYRKSQLLALLLCIGSIDVALASPQIEQRLVDALLDLHETGILSAGFVDAL